MAERAGALARSADLDYAALALVDTHITTSCVTLYLHRCHHANVDGPDDPHSPIVFGIWRVLFRTRASITAPPRRSDHRAVREGHTR